MCNQDINHWSIHTCEFYRTRYVLVDWLKIFFHHLNSYKIYESYDPKVKVEESELNLNFSHLALQSMVVEGPKLLMEPAEYTSVKYCCSKT